MPKLNIEYTVDRRKAAAMRSKINQQVRQRERRGMRHRIVLALLVSSAIVLRFGVQEKLLLIDKPANSTTFGSAVIEQTWYSHPVVLFFICVLIAPIILLSIFASENTKEWIPFSLKLASIYYYYIRGLCSTSILVDLLQAYFHEGQPASLFSALLCYFQDNVWIDPYTDTKQLWMPSYQTTITSFATCFCLMMINETFKSWLAPYTFPRIFLRALAVALVSPTVAVISYDCYEDYMTPNSPIYAEFYYASVILGMVIAILEVQGTMHYDPPPNEYFVILRCHDADQLPIGVNLGPHMPMDKNDDNAQEVHYVSAQCYRHFKIQERIYDTLKFSTMRAKKTNENLLET